MAGTASTTRRLSWRRPSYATTIISMLTIVAKPSLATAAEPLLITSALSPAVCSALADALASASETQSHTRWWSASSQPQTPLEHAAASVFAFHTDGMPFSPALSGAEYWVKFHVEDEDGDRGPLGGGVHLRAPRTHTTPFHPAPWLATLSTRR